MSWVETSFMGRNGASGGADGTKHRLSEEAQGEFHYFYGPYAKPVMRIAPGDTVEVETLDAFGGAIKTEDDLPSQVLNMPFVNPQNGPIAVEGAQKGDVLAVHILDLLPRGPQPAGTTALIPSFGALVADGLQMDTSDNLLCRPRSPWRAAFCARYRGSLGLMGWFSVRAGVRRAHLGLEAIAIGPCCRPCWPS